MDVGQSWVSIRRRLPNPHRTAATFSLTLATCRPSCNVAATLRLSNLQRLQESAYVPREMANVLARGHGRFAARTAVRVTFLGGMQTIPAGESVFLTIDLEPGVQYTALDFTTKSKERFTVS